MNLRTYRIAKIIRTIGRKKLPLLLLFLSVSWSGYSQQIEILNNQNLNLSSTSDFGVVVSEKTTSCGADTARYTLGKASGLSLIAINNATSASAVSQYFNCPQELELSGVEFYGYKADTVGGVMIDVTVSVYSAGSDSLPSGAPLASQVVSIDTNFYGGNLSLLRKTASFQTLALNAPYILVVENNTPNGIGLAFNNYAATPADGLQEELCGLNIVGQWSKSNTFVFNGLPLDFDALLSPIVSYTIESSFASSENCFTNGPDISFTNASSPIFFDRMYNQAAFINNPALSFDWDFDDGNSGLAVDTTYTFTDTTSSYSVRLLATVFGWTVNCSDSSLLTIGNDLSADFIITNNEPEVVLTNTTVNADSLTLYEWNMGDGTFFSTENVSHTYAVNGSYTITLVATGPCGSDTTTQTVMVASVGLEDFLNENVQVYPNPADNVINVKSGIKITAIKLSDVLGREVTYENIDDTSYSFSVLNYLEGAYLMRVITEKGEFSKPIYILH